MTSGSECRLCGEPDESICDLCGRVVCFGCMDDDLCAECAMEEEA